MIRILLVEDQKLFSEGIQILIGQEDDMEIIGVANDGVSAIELVDELLPDVVLMEINIPELDGISAAKKMKELAYVPNIVFLTNLPEERLVIEALEVGASGFLSKTLLPENLYRAVRDAYKGQYILSGDVAEMMVRHIKGMALDEQHIVNKKLRGFGVELTQRELDIIMLLFKGYSNQEISNKTGLSIGTIKNYVSIIYNKINIHYRKDAIAFYHQLMES
ncbi:response regulator [Virgibacillus halophilus]|uniref:Response regulator transcription factor n=1 Tax=Tigheibacillus halophilus TaxID=361280 RepID=A0ABU5C2I6_9BACI|nr:response regulator transcription factor [Virgibacillus halophilus]